MSPRDEFKIRAAATSEAHDRILSFTRVFDAPRNMVFKAWTDLEQVAQWWGPQGFIVSFLEMDVRPGGAWRKCMRSPEGIDYWRRGTYLEVVEPERLVFTYVSDDPASLPDHETIVTITFVDRGTKTLMTFRQAEFESVAARDSHRGGWSSCIERVARHLGAAFAGSKILEGVKLAPMQAIISISNLTKTYATGLQALKLIDLEIHKGEIFGLLGPNGAGKTTLISIICGIVTPTTGTVLAAGHDIVRDYRASRSMIGLVPQELHTDMFETVLNTVKFSRGLFGRERKPAHIERVLRELSLWEKRNDKIMTLSGGMKRRVLIAKALAHEPEILFLDEPTAGVDVELRRDMWALVRRLRDSGVTIILTTHYIDEAEEMADRIGVISKGELILVEEKTRLMKKLGKKQLTLHLQEPMRQIPAGLADWPLVLKSQGYDLEYSFDSNEEGSSIPTLLRRLNELGIGFKDLQTEQSSLEDIFVSLVHQRT